MIVLNVFVGVCEFVLVVYACVRCSNLYYCYLIYLISIY